MTVAARVRHVAPEPPRIRADGTIPAVCPICGTIGTTFRPEPGAYIMQRCPRRTCGIYYAIMIWPHWTAVVDVPSPSD